MDYFDGGRMRKGNRGKRRGMVSALDILARAKVLRQDVPENFAAELELAVLAALAMVGQGVGSLDHWDRLSQALNQSWVLCCGGVGHEAREHLERSQAAMRRMIPIYESTGSLAFASPEDREAIEAAISMWSQQIRMVTIGQYHKVVELVDAEYWRAREAA